MIPVDNTPASIRALENVLKLSAPTDHIIIVHGKLHCPLKCLQLTSPSPPPTVREWAETDTRLQDAYTKWRAAVKLCRKYKKRLVAANRVQSYCPSFRELLMSNPLIASHNTCTRSP